MAGQQRRLAAIVSVDVAGYSRLMGEDENGTHQQLKAHRRELLDPLIAQHGGRIVKTTGDGMLLEFPSVVAAVECSIDAQNGMLLRNVNVVDDQAIRFRIGVHLGDLIDDDNDIFGESVNIAARLQELSTPSGIVASEDIYRQLKGPVRLGFGDVGLRQLKNISGARRLFAWPIATLLKTKPEEPFNGALPSVEVVPFTTQFSTEAHQAFAEGLYDEIVVGLSTARWLTIVGPAAHGVGSASSAARYAVETKVRISANRVRVQYRIVDKRTSQQLSANRIDGVLDDPFDLQERVAQEIASATEYRISDLERSSLKDKSTAELTSWECYLLGYWKLFESDAREADAAISLLKRAVSINDHFARAYVALSAAHHNKAMVGSCEGPESHIAMAAETARMALSLDRDDVMAHCQMAIAHIYLNQKREAMTEATRAIELAPNHPQALGTMGNCLLWEGKLDECLPFLDRAIRVGAREPFLIWYFIWKSLAHYFRREFADALAAARAGIRISPSYSLLYLYESVTLAQMERIDEARAALIRHEDLAKGQRLNTKVPSAYMSEEFRHLLVDGIRKARGGRP
jgi:adenylate cyclase